VKWRRNLRDLLGSDGVNFFVQKKGKVFFADLLKRCRIRQKRIREIGKIERGKINFRRKLKNEF